MLCILCVTYPEQKINIFDEHGLSLDIKTIIAKHFWLQPNANNDNARVICSFCWDALESFHKFYEKVEEAHLTLANVQLVGDELKLEDSSNGYSDLLLGIKVEVLEDLKVDPPLSETDVIADPLESVERKEQLVKEDAKSDSESEIPLSLLARSKNSPKLKRADKLRGKIESHLIQRRRIRKIRRAKAPVEYSKGAGIATPWLATCFGEESDKRVCTETFDEVIKQNMNLACNICCLPLANFFALQEHYEFVHKERGYAGCCGKKFDKRGTLVDHILLHKYPEYFKCDKCPKVLSNRKNLKEHAKIHDKKLDFQCEKCNKAFHRKLLLDRHMDIHVTERTYKCEECDKYFASKFSLGQHKYGVHKGGYTKICDQCGKVTRDQEAFRRHQLEHTGKPKPFVNCEKCGVRLANRQGLTRHMKSQHPERQVSHVCNVCGTVTSSIYALRRHVTYMHKYERSHKCPMCDKGFKRALTLKVSDVYRI